MKKSTILWLLIGIVLAWSTACAATDYVGEINRAGLPHEAIIAAQFNGGNFGSSKSDETLKRMAKMFREADMVIMEEVSTYKDAGKKTAYKLLDELQRTGDGSWHLLASPITVGPGKEMYVVYYKASKLRPIREEFALSKLLRDELDREPAMATFEVKKTGFRFMAVAFHLVPTNKNPRREVELLAEKPQEFLTGSAIFVGDFNLPIEALRGPFQSAFNATALIEGKTSLKQKIDKKGGYFSQAYDNIMVRGIKVLKTAIVDTVRLSGSLDSARELSDHCPVILVFDPH